MPVDHRTTQPFGFITCGVSVALAETIGSLAGSGARKRRDKGFNACHGRRWSGYKHPI